MRTELMGYSEMFGENPSLTTLFGSDVEQDIAEVAAETGLSPATVRKAVIDYAPELLGYSEMFGEDTAPAKGTTFANVLKAIAESIGTAAPGIAAAARGTPAAPTVQTAPSFDPTSLIIPGAIAAALLFLIMKK